MNKKYLPSKNFQKLLGALILIGLLIFAGFKLFSGKSAFYSSKGEIKSTNKFTLNELTKKDSDGDGIADWEESLWGTDPKNKETFGMPDMTYVKEVRTELKGDTVSGTGGIGLGETETEKFARQFFSSYLAMRSSGQADGGVMSDFSKSMMDKILDEPIVDQYKDSDLKMADADDKKDKKDYYIAIATLFENYKKKGIGEELSVAGNMVSTGKTEDLEGQRALLEVADAYKNFSEAALSIPVPKSLKDYHLKIVNSSYNTGVAIVNMSKMLSDPIVGISGNSQYEKYSSELIIAVGDLENFLLEGGII